MITLKFLPTLILFFLIFYFLFLFSIEPFIVKPNLKALQKVFIVIGFSAIPIIITFAFIVSIIY